MLQKRKDESWRKHPRYMADASGLFGGPPGLACQNCKKSTYELFYGHCRPCAAEKEIPREMAAPQVFHDALEKGSTTVMEAPPKRWYPLWHWRRWISR
jgi:hypothetical protein